MAYFDPADYSEDLSRYIIPPDSVLIGMSGTIKIARYAGGAGRHYLNQRVGMFQPGSLLNKDYLYHVLASSIGKLYEAAGSGGSVVNLSAAAIRGFLLPLPSLERQAEIVDILDSFDALVADISVGLPAELEARRKQYEHYRDKLLTFLRT